MNRLKIGEFTIFPGNQLIVYLQDGSERIVRWGLTFSIKERKKLYCNNHSFVFYKNWKPCVFNTGDYYLGGITNGASLLVYAKDYQPIQLKADEFFKLYSELSLRGKE